MITTPLAAATAVVAATRRSAAASTIGMAGTSVGASALTQPPNLPGLQSKSLDATPPHCGSGGGNSSSILSGVATVVPRRTLWLRMRSESEAAATPPGDRTPAPPGSVNSRGSDTQTPTSPQFSASAATRALKPAGHPPAHDGPSTTGPRSTETANDDSAVLVATTRAQTGTSGAEAHSPAAITRLRVRELAPTVVRHGALLTPVLAGEASPPTLPPELDVGSPALTSAKTAGAPSTAAASSYVSAAGRQLHLRPTRYGVLGDEVTYNVARDDGSVRTVRRWTRYEQYAFPDAALFDSEPAVVAIAAAPTGTVSSPQRPGYRSIITRYRTYDATLCGKAAPGVCPSYTTVHKWSVMLVRAPPAQPHATQGSAPGSSAASTPVRRIQDGVASPPRPLRTVLLQAASAASQIVPPT